MMPKMCKYPQDVIRCVRSSYYIDKLLIIYLFLKRNSISNGTFDISCGMFSNVIISNVINLVLRDSDTDSENTSLIWRSVSEDQKTNNSKKRIVVRFIVRNYINLYLFPSDGSLQLLGKVAAAWQDK